MSQSAETVVLRTLRVRLLFNRSCRLSAIRPQNVLSPSRHSVYDMHVDLFSLFRRRNLSRIKGRFLVTLLSSQPGLLVLYVH